MKYLTAEQVLFIHSRIVAETGGSHGVRELGLLESAVGRPQATFDDKDLYRDPFTKAAALMLSLINNHPFVDGNKRTGVTAAGLFLRINGMKLAVSQEELETCATRVALKQIEIAELSDWLREHAVPVN
ncbi:MAG: type II toxin-antitoxin system death-on-curing family toxin [Chloroflexi bacterium]|nr:type II toxin-antitoxin system death-on-curing family toxin [Chloroflexota bacterium]